MQDCDEDSDKGNILELESYSLHELHSIEWKLVSGRMLCVIFIARITM